MNSSRTEIKLGRLIPFLEKRGTVVLLESQSHKHPAAQKSYIAALPEEELWAYGDRVTRKKGDEKSTESGRNPWDELKKIHMETDGWLFGYLGYDLKNHLEHLTSENTDPIKAPDCYMMNPGLLIEVTRDGWSVLKGEIPKQFFENRKIRLKNCSIQHLRPVISDEEYRAMIRRAQDHINEGDYYEINLTHQMHGVFEGAAYKLYENMKREGPVPFGAYLSFGSNADQLHICSASPERFLAKHGKRVFSQPIKGTIHRGANEAEDRQLKQWLASSEKNKAENLMIVDLVRNDLGRIAAEGSVQVPKLFEIQSFDTVHQMVSTVEAEVGDYHPVEVIKACFPMGSMTGAPKISAMRSIEELEDYRRGIYSGGIGYLTPAGDFDFNVVIRTAIIKGHDLFYSVGGAITSDSDPASEWQETMIKAKALTSVRQGQIEAV